MTLAPSLGPEVYYAPVSEVSITDRISVTSLLGARVQSSGPTRGKERTSSSKLSSDLHTSAV